jgi:ribonucleotide reductase alpha subunit
MDRFSNTCREVAMQGRRGALMLTISVHHPEIETFITIKQDKTRVTGANISIFFTDEFMNAVKNDEEYEQRWPVDSKNPSIVKNVRAKDIWNKFIHSTWASAEPGALFESTIRRMTPSDIYKDEGFGTVSTNPCFHGDEYILLKNGYVKFKDSLEKDLGEPLTDNRISYIDDGKEESPEKWKIDLSKIGVTQQPYNGSAFVTKEFSELLELEFSNGQTLKCTPDHHIATTVGMVEAKDLTNDHEILVAKPEKVEFKLPETEEELKYYLFGAILSCDEEDLEYYYIYNLEDNIKILRMFNIDFDFRIKEQINSKWSFSKLENIENIPVNKNVLRIKKECVSLFDNSNEIVIEHVLNNCLNNIGKNFICGFIGNNPCNNVYYGPLPEFNKDFVNKIKLIFSANGILESNSTKLISKKEIEGDTVYCIKEPNTRSIIVNSISTRRCGEIVLSPYDSCRLIALNLYSFVENKFKENAYFDFDKFIEKTRLAQRMMDDLIDLEIEAVDKIIAKVESDPEPQNIKATELDLWNKIKTACVKGRRTGLGITGLGDTIAALGMRYGDEKSIAMTEKIYKYLTCSSYRESIQLAKERGAFSVWSYEKEKDHPFIKRIMEGVIEMFGEEVYEDYKLYGRRNIANTTTAPTGTVSTQTQTTSGIEPPFMLKYNRKKKVNPGDNNVKVDFVDDMGDSWQTFVIYHHGFKDWMDITGKTEVEQSPYYKATANDVDWLASVDIQASAQKYVDHSISKTCNLPKDVSEELVSDIYMRAWEKGCKGFTIYREGCRDGVLTSIEQIEAEVKERRSALKRPSKLVSETTKIKLDTGDGVKNAYITVSFFPDTKKPYEVFVNAPVGQNVKDLQIVELSSRMTSLALRHGVSADFIVDQLSKIDGQYIYSIPVGLAKALSPYISNEEEIVDLCEEENEEVSEDENSSVRTSKCPSCGNKSYIIEEGCGKCLDCMYSRCS